MKRLNPIQRIFLRVEQQEYPIDTMGIYILEPTARGPLPFETVTAAFARLVAERPVLRRQLAQTSYGWGTERWMQASSVDLDHHLSRAVVPPPGDLNALLDLAVRLSATPLDRRRPLWRVWYAESAAQSRTVLLVRAHQALVDGLGGLSLYDELFDEEPVGVDPMEQPPEITGDPEPSMAQLLGKAVPDSIAMVRGAAGQAARFVWGPRRPVETQRSRPPRTPFEQIARHSTKVLAAVSIPRRHVDDIRAARPELSIGDVLLTALTGAVRTYLAQIDALPDKPIRVATPTFVPGRSETDNPFTVMLLDLPVEVEDRHERLAIVHRRNSRRRAAYRQARSGTDAVSVVSQLVHPGLIATGTTVLGNRVMNFLPPLTNLTFASITIPGGPRYFAGTKVAHCYGRTFVIPPQQVFVHAVVYDELVEFGITSLRETVPNPETLMRLVRSEMEALARDIG